MFAASLCVGCDQETAGAAGLTASNVLVAPLVYPVAATAQLGRNQENTVQPVLVTTGDGKVLSPSFEGTPEAEFRTSRRTVICSGEIPYFRGADVHDGFIPCSGGKRAQAKLFSHYGKQLVLDIGPANVAVRELNRPQAAYPIYALGEVEFRCKGNYSSSSGRAAPFMIGCGSRFSEGVGAVSLQAKDGKRKHLTVWVDAPL